MKNIYITILVIVVALVAVWLYTSQNKRRETVNPAVETTPAAALTEITYGESGFSPATVEIDAGDVVAFKNNDDRPIWPASAVHPTHRVYPGSGIEKCGTAAAGSIFDACSNVLSGNSWSFRFDEIGTWKYHNHLNPNHTGTVIVK